MTTPELLASIRGPADLRDLDGDQLTALAAEIRTVLRMGDVHTFLVAPTLLGRDVPALLEEAVPELVGHGPEQLLLDELPFLRHAWVWGANDAAWAVMLRTPFATLIADGRRSPLPKPPALSYSP